MRSSRARSHDWSRWYASRVDEDCASGCAATRKALWYATRSRLDLEQSRIFVLDCSAFEDHPEIATFFIQTESDGQALRVADYVQTIKEGA